MKLRFYLRGLGIGMAVTAVILHFAVAVKSHAMSDDEIRARARQLGMKEEGVLLSDETGASGSDAGNADSGNEGGEGQTMQEVIIAGAGEETEPVITPVTENEESGDAAQSGSNGENGNTEGTEAQDQSGAAGADQGNGETEKPEEPQGGTQTEQQTGGQDTQSADAHQDTQNTQPEDTHQNTQDTQPETAQPDTQNTQQADTQAAGGEGDQHGLNSGSVNITIVRGDSSYTVAKRMAEAGVVPSAAEFDEFLCRNGYDRTLCIGVHAIPSGASYDEMGRILTGKQ